MQIVLIEVLSIILSLYLLLRKTSSTDSITEHPQIDISIRLLSLWAFTQVFVDMYTGPEIIERIKTVASIITLICLLISAKNLFTNSMYKLDAFLVGYFSSCVPTYFFFPTEYAKSQPWKFCFALYATFFIYWVVGRKKFRPFSIIFSSFILVVIDLIFNSRALAALTLFAALWTLYNFKVKRSNLMFSFIMVVIVILLIGRGSLMFASSGLLGNQVAEKTRAQSSMGPILLVARSEFLYEIQVIKENFLFGAGSNPKIQIATLNQVWFIESELGINSRATSAFSKVEKTQKVPEHSMLFTAWVEGGLLAAIVWIYLLSIFIKWLIRPLRPNHHLSYLCSLMLITGIWSILFSPLGTGSRLQIAITLFVGQFCNSNTVKSESA